MTRGVGKLRAIGIGDLTLLLMGLGAGLSPLFRGYYSETVWSSIGLCLVLAAGVMVAAGRLSVPPGAARLAVGGLVGLGLLALLSALWSSSPDGAMVAAGRLFAYSAVIVLTCGLACNQRRRMLALFAIGAGLAVVALATLVRMLGPDATSLFLGGRLSSPVEYAGGTGCAFALGTWLCLGVAVRRAPVAAGAGVFAAVLMASLAVLSESRSALYSMVVAIAVVLTVQWERRTAWTLIVAGAGLAVALPALVHVYATGGGRVTADTAHTAGLTALGAGLAAGLVWGGATEIAARVAHRGNGAGLARASRVGLASLAVIVVVAVSVEAGPISRKARNEWRSFTNLSLVSAQEAHGQSRLLLAGGPYKEYWRVELKMLSAHPLAGAGAGGWPRAWFEQRRYYDPVWFPNSIAFGTLSELGAIGGLLLATFLTGVGLAAWRVRRGGRGPQQPLVVAAVGVSAASLAFATSEWVYVALPGIMAIGLVAIGVVLAGFAAPSDTVAPIARVSGSTFTRWTWRGGLVVVFTGAVVLLGRIAVADTFRDLATGDIIENPARAVRRANASLSINGDAVWTYYVKAAGLARLGRARQAREALLMARRREPDNLVTWALLGDIDLRRGDLALARVEYRHARQLDPLDASLLTIPSDPTIAAAIVAPRPSNVLARPGLIGFQILKDTPPLDLARALGAQGLQPSDLVVDGRFGYGIG